MQDPIKIQQTIDDLKEVQEKISERHKDEPTFNLRVNSVFNQLINSLSVTTGGVTERAVSGFTPKPLASIAGKNLAGKRNVKIADVKPEKEQTLEEFRENVQKAYDSFLNRETTELKDSLFEDEIRGVAKLAGLEDFQDAKVDGHYINKIKKAITSKNDLDVKKATEKTKEEADKKDLEDKK